jgi:hypothetical protein
MTVPPPLSLPSHRCQVSYTRYSGVEASPITGSLEVGMQGKCFLKWDNSYAKCSFVSLDLSLTLCSLCQ